MTVKILCSCGSKYSFDVEPLEGRMPFAVHCPTCNADGTDAANQVITESLAAETSGKPKLRVSAAATAALAREEPPPFPRAPAAGAAMRRLQRDRRQNRLVGWIAGAVALMIVALLAAWAWFAFIGSKPRLSYSVKLPGAPAGWRAEFLDADKLLLVNPDRATVHDLAGGRDLWSATLSGNSSGGGAAPQMFVDKQSIWICLGARLLCLDRATGRIKQTIPVTGQFKSFTPSDSSLLVVSARDETTRLAMRIDLASGEVSTDEISVPRAQKHPMPNELPPNVQPTAGVLLAQALEEKKFNQPLDAMSSEFFSAGANLVELRVKLLEPKVVFTQSIKPRGPSHINGSLSASSSVADVEEEVFNDIKRSQTGGVKGLDQSRYEVRLRRWLGAAPAEWTGQVAGVPMFFPLRSVDLLTAGQSLTVFDKENKKLFDANLAYPIGDQFNPEHWDRLSAPAVEGNGALYFFDKGVLTAFSLPSGGVRWRLTSVGINRIQLDGRGALYVDSTTASPEDIQYSDQIKFQQAAPVLLKIDPSSGHILWKAADCGRECFLSGPFLYAAIAEQGGIAMANGLAEALNAPRPGSPVFFHIYRLDPDDGKVLWRFFREAAPADLSFRQNRFLVRFGNDLEVWKFLSF
jgi:outer membrane protein assembly factor BamB